ncbi:uncharacterized protein LOC135209351 [Macrobrachium nipponense]|uniref:uncharacterized protein LOC135209351 n=1 Tax=Macrobrachium nipponense TaxID=159736 RepID=UPI0030C7FA9B
MLFSGILTVAKAVGNQVMLKRYPLSHPFPFLDTPAPPFPITPTRIQGPPPLTPRQPNPPRTPSSHHPSSPSLLAGFPFNSPSPPGAPDGGREPGQEPLDGPPEPTWISFPSRSRYFECKIRLWSRGGGFTKHHQIGAYLIAEDPARSSALLPLPPTPTPPPPPPPPPPPADASAGAGHLPSIAVVATICFSPSYNILREGFRFLTGCILIPEIMSGGPSSPSIMSGGPSSPSIMSGGPSSPSIMSGGPLSSPIMSGGPSSPSTISGGPSSPSIMSRGPSFPSNISGGPSSPSIMSG